MEARSVTSGIRAVDPAARSTTPTSFYCGYPPATSDLDHYQQQPWLPLPPQQQNPPPPWPPHPPPYYPPYQNAPYPYPQQNPLPPQYSLPPYYHYPPQPPHQNPNPIPATPPVADHNPSSPPPWLPQPPQQQPSPPLTWPPSPPPQQKQWDPPPPPGDHLPSPPGSFAPPPPPYYYPQPYHPQQINQEWGAQIQQVWEYHFETARQLFDEMSERQSKAEFQVDEQATLVVVSQQPSPSSVSTFNPGLQSGMKNVSSAIAQETGNASSSSTSSHPSYVATVTSYGSTMALSSAPNVRLMTPSFNMMYGMPGTPALPGTTHSVQMAFNPSARPAQVNSSSIPLRPASQTPIVASPFIQPQAGAPYSGMVANSHGVWLQSSQMEGILRSPYQPHPNASQPPYVSLSYQTSSEAAPQSEFTNPSHYPIGMEAQGMSSTSHFVQYQSDSNYAEMAPKLQCFGGSGSFSEMVGSVDLPECAGISNPGCVANYNPNRDMGIDRASAMGANECDDRNVTDEGALGASPNGKRRKRINESSPNKNAKGELNKDVSDRRHADYLEDPVACYVWKSFITQDSRDRDLLVRNLKSVDVPVLNYVENESQQQPFHISEEMSALGIYSRLDQVLDAPKAVKEVLTSQFGLDRSYIGSQQTDQKAEQVSNLGILDFWTPDSHYRGTISRYGGHISASVDPVDHSKLFLCVVDTGEIERLKSNQTELEESVATLQKSVRMLQIEQRQIEDEEGKLRKEGEKFEREWEDLDDRKTKVDAELIKVVKEREELERLQCIKAERLKDEREAVEDFRHREMENLKQEKESFATRMSNEQITLSEKAQSEHAQMVRDFESRKRGLEDDGAVEDERQICATIKKSLASDNMLSPRIYTFGLGSFCNHYFLRMLAMIGRGQHDAAYDIDLIQPRIQKLFGRASSVILTNITMETLDDLDNVEVYPCQIPDLSFESPLSVYGRFRGKLPESFKVKGLSADMSSSVIDLKLQDAKDVPLHRVFAKEEFKLLTTQAWLFEDKQLEDKVAKLSKCVGVFSEYTRMGIFQKEEVYQKGSKKGQSEKKEIETLKMILPDSLCVGFGDLAATSDNLFPGTEPPKLPEAAEIFLQSTSNCCGSMCNNCCCLSFIKCGSHINPQCANGLMQLFTGLACAGYLACCSEVWCAGITDELIVNQESLFSFICQARGRACFEGGGIVMSYI